MAEKKTVQSAERIFEILETLAQNGAMGLTELSVLLNLHKSTTHRLLNSLSVMGYVKKDANGKYTLTFKILEMAGKVLGHINIVATAHPYMERLEQQSRETVHFVQREGDNIVYIDKVECEANMIRMVSYIGLRLPMFCTGVGKAIMAQLTDSEIREIWQRSDIKKLTEKTIVDQQEFFREIDKIRRCGYALDNEENEMGVRCIAACVTDYTGNSHNAFSISAPSSRMSDERIEELSRYILETKRELSRELGARPSLS